MAVGVVTGNATVEPQRLRRTQIIGKHLFEVVPREFRVARLYIAEQAFLGRQDGAATVHVDAATFEYDALHVP